MLALIQILLFPGYASIPFCVLIFISPPIPEKWKVNKTSQTLCRTQPSLALSPYRPLVIQACSTCSAITLSNNDDTTAATPTPTPNPVNVPQAKTNSWSAISSHQVDWTKSTASRTYDTSSGTASVSTMATGMSKSGGNLGNRVAFSVVFVAVGMAGLLIVW